MRAGLPFFCAYYCRQTATPLARGAPGSGFFAIDIGLPNRNAPYNGSVRRPLRASAGPCDGFISNQRIDR
jgi:hypothetical protein